MSRKLRALLKLFVCAGHLLAGMWTIRTRFAHSSADQRNALIANWAQALLNELGVTLRIHGQPVQQGPLLVVCNHISWLDILVLMAAQPVRFVSKTEVRAWPVIGWLATQVGTLYIARSSRKDAHRMVSTLAEHLRLGGMIAVFPEGTTSEGTTVLPFHGNLLQSAIEAQAPVQAVALQYLDNDGSRSMSASYVGDDSLVGSVWRLLCAPALCAQLQYHAPLQADTLSRKQLASLLHSTIADAIQSGKPPNS